MKRLILALAFLLALALPAPALAAFGLNGFDVLFEEKDGSFDAQAGSHPFAMTVSFKANTIEEGGEIVPEEAVKDIFAAQPEGFAGSPTAVPRCSTLDFLDIDSVDRNLPNCADGSAIGIIQVFINPEEALDPTKADPFSLSPVYLLEPPPGVAAKLGFVVLGAPVTVEVGVGEERPYPIVGASRDVSQALNFYGAELTLWGDPASPDHNKERGPCRPAGKKAGQACPAGVTEAPFLTLPRSCSGPLKSSFEADSWQHPGSYLPNGAPDLSDPNWVSGFAETHDELGNPKGMSGCAKLGFGPQASVSPTTDQASSPSGLSFSLNVNDEGLANPHGIAQSDIEETVVALPQGLTLNPSVAEGLKACSEEELKRITASSPPGVGCPEASKVGTVEVQTPLLPEDRLQGSLYVATPYENPFGSLIALYLTIKDPGLGVKVTQPIEVKADPKTGQIIATASDLPQFPLSHVEIRLREGGRAPLISPPGCGSFETLTTLVPWANPSSSYEVSSPFQISHGAGGAPCPPAGTLPFAPGFDAGSIDNTAGAYSSFFMRLTRPDGNQDITRFDATLPPGVAGKIAGVAQCPDASIAAARQKTGKGEQANPSCPATSQIGRVEGGAGVGGELTYVPGKLYLAGPLNGAPLSVVAIVPAVAGPYDVGNVVVRQALRVNPRTGQVSVDSSASDQIPHILAGIPLAVRDIRVYVDRPNFTINPTGCLPTATRASIWGGGIDPFSTADDSPFPALAPFQAASCASLPFKPSLSLTLKGGTKRGAHPALANLYMPRLGDANLKGLTLRFPHSAFLDQGHIRTVCTRVQYAAKACPPGSIYGEATAKTPLLAEPLTGPVYLRSSDHNLPDLVIALHGIVDVEAVARIDSIHGGIRASLEELPDAPLNEALVSMPPGQKGLIVNSTDLCAKRHDARASLTAQNGASLILTPQVKPTGCARGSSAKYKRHR